LLSLAIAIAGALTLFFGNFTLAYVFQALRGESVRASGLLGSLLFTALPLAALLWAGRLWWRVRRSNTGAMRSQRVPLVRRPETLPSAPPPRPSAQRATESDERERLLALAARRGGVDIDEALTGSGLRANELTYLLDAMIAEGRLEVDVTDDGLRYRLGRAPRDAEAGSDTFP
jgi:hypothetical protein